MEKTGEYKRYCASYLVNSKGKLTYSALGNELLNCAGLHANERGFGRKTTAEGTYAWVLSRLVMEMDDMPGEYEDFTLRTWVENIYHSFSNRNFEILNANGRSIGFARSVWAMIDMEKRQTVDLLSMHGENMAAAVDAGRECPIDKMSRIRVHAETPTAQHAVKWSDIDINRHVNSMKYIEHIFDLFTLQWHEAHPTRRFEIAYMAETCYGDTLGYYMDEVGEKEYVIEIRKNDTTPVVHSRIIFA